MKITHFIRNFEIGGLESMVLRLMRIQISSGHNVRVVCIEKETLGTVKYDDLNASIIHLNKRFKLIALLRIAIELFFHRPDVINSHNFLSNIYASYVGNMFNIPICLTLHSGAPQSTLEFKRNAILIPKHYICVSEQIKNRLLDASEKKITNNQVSVILNGIDIDEFMVDSRLSGRSEFFIKEGEIVIGTVGRLHPVKNQKMLINSFSTLVNKYTNIKLLIVGDGPLKTELRQHALELGVDDKICWAGNRNDVNRMLASMDIFVLPSSFEGSPISLIEAMCSRLPVIATSVGSIPKIISNDKNGYLVSAGDENLLASLVEQLICDSVKRIELGRNAYETVKKEYSMEIMNVSYMKVYKSIANI